MKAKLCHKFKCVGGFCVLLTFKIGKHKTDKWKFLILIILEESFPGGAVVKNLPANAGDMGLSPGPGRSHMPRSN